jgi:hypothetical protein
MSFEKFAVCGLFDSVNYVEVKNNKIRYCIGVLLPAGVISKNFFDTTTLLAAGLNLRFLGLIKADSNISRCCYYDVFVDQGGVSIQATGNIVQHKRINPILRAAGGAPNNILRNNVIYYNFPYCYDCDDLIISSGTNCIYENNTFIRPSEVGFHVAPGTIIKNNILMRSHYGIELINSGSVDVQYNNFWLVDHRYKDFSIEKDTTNISFNPMFIKDVPVYPFNPQTPGDVHLQRYSPLIDRGDPAILDRDNTRSDIGAYGGPFGEIYEYRDLAPLPPQNLLSIISDSIRSLTLFWSPNTEADLWGYNIYADTISGFVADSTKKIGTTADTTFTVNISNKRKLYLVIKAMDAQGNISQPSAEIAFIRTGIENKPKIIMEQYKLYPNYPNPFNATTKIPYYVSEPSYVNLTITDITGRDHGYLFNGERQPGYYEEIFTAGERGKEYDEEFSLTSGIYFYHIEITNLNTGHLSFMETRKMVYLK